MNSENFFPGKGSIAQVPFFYSKEHNERMNTFLKESLDITSQEGKTMENIDTTPLDAVIAISPEKLKELEMLGALDPETDGEVLGYVQSETDFDEVKPN